MAEPLTEEAVQLRERLVRLEVKMNIIAYMAGASFTATCVLIATLAVTR